MLNELRQDLIEHEGKRNNPYFDSLGFATFGIGRNLIGKPLTKEERDEGRRLGYSSDAFVDYLFQRDVADALKDAHSVAPWLGEAPENVQRAVANMSFQMGRQRLSMFKPSLALVRAGRYREAGARLRKSLWARQTPKRAHDVISLIESCEV